MEEFTEKEYNEMYQLFCLGKIDESVWRAYCFDFLKYLMEKNKDVLERLKEL